MKARFFIVVGIMMGALLTILPAFGSDPAPTPTPKVRKSSGPKSLGDIAGGIKLDKSKDSKGVVIDNSNLKELGDGAVVSRGGSLAPSIQSGGDSGEDADGEALEDPGAASSGDRKKLSKVEILEAQLEAVRQAEDENKKANIYNGMGPQYRSPGTKDPLQEQRKALEVELEKAKAASGGNAGNRRNRE